MKTLENVIMDASEEWCQGDPWQVLQEEAAAIAEAVRGLHAWGSGLDFTGRSNPAGDCLENWGTCREGAFRRDRN